MDAALTDERLCGRCGHSVVDHYDWEGDVHECNAKDCGCLQFVDKEPSELAAPESINSTQDNQGEAK